MKMLDDELRNLMKRREPPAGFAGRVMARLGEGPARVASAGRMSGFFCRPVLRWAAVAAVLCVIAAASIVWRRQHQQRMRRQARQAISALELASSELNTALQQAHYMTVHAISIPLERGTRKE